jgi:AcrR family transcriptional regulator
MASESENAGTIIEAAFALALAGRWRSISLADIAERAHLPLADVWAVCPGKMAVLRAYNRRIDAAMIKDPLEATESVREKLFELLMRRFEALTKDRGAIAEITRDVMTSDPLAGLAGLCSVRRSMRLALEAAGVSTSGPLGRLKISVLSAIYLRVLSSWLRSREDGTDKVMADLDRALARVERAAEGIGRGPRSWRVRSEERDAPAARRPANP